MYFEWRDTENQQLNRLPNIRACMGKKTIILLIIIIIIIIIIIALSFFFNGLSSSNLDYRGHEKKNEKKKKIHAHTVYIKHNAKVGGVVSKFLLTGIMVYSPYCGRLFYATMQKLATIRGFSIQCKTVIVSLTFFMINNYFHIPFFGLSWIC